MHRSSRRHFLLQSGGLIAAAAQPFGGSQRAFAAPTERVQLPQGIQIGDVTSDRALIWTRADRPGRLIVEWSLDERMRKAQRVRGPYALEDSDFTARLDLSGLPPDQTRLFACGVRERTCRQHGHE